MDYSGSSEFAYIDVAVLRGDELLDVIQEGQVVLDAGVNHEPLFPLPNHIDVCSAQEAMSWILTRNEVN